MVTKELGKIDYVGFGHGGYQDAMIGLSLSFEMGCGGVSTFIGFWDDNMIDCGDTTKWTEQDRSDNHGKTVTKISNLLREAKVHDVYELKGKPVEVKMDGNMFKSFRILTEVL